MFWVRIHLAILVLSIQLVARYHRRSRLPYFPIEISRTAECNEINRWLFPLGSLLLGVTIVVTTGFTVGRTIAWLGLLFLSVFDDKKYWWLHLLGVKIMLLGVIYSNYQLLDPTVNLGELILAMLIYIVRTLLKIMVVMRYELDNDWNVKTIHKIASMLLDKIRDISYYGDKACRNSQTLLIFQICGVLQWIAFLMLTMILA